MSVPARPTNAPARPGRPTRPRLADRYDRKRQQMVREAARVFAQTGYDQTTIQDLADALDWSAGGIYHYVSSKEDLLVLICQQLMEPLLEQAEAILAGEAGPAEHLREVVRLWVRHGTSHRDHQLVFNQELHIIDSGARWRSVRASRKAFERLVEGVIARLGADGDLAISDERLAVAALLGMVNHTVQWYRPRGRLSAEQIADGYTSLILGTATAA